MKRWRNWIFASLLGFLFFEILVVFPKRLEKSNVIEDKQKRLNEMSQQPEQLMQKIQVVESQKGSRDWELFAEAAEGSQEKAIWALQNVKVQFYNKGQKEYLVTGKTGQIEGKSKNMTIEGNVITRSANGYIFKTEQVYYLAHDRIIRTPGHLDMQGPEDSQGQGLQLTGNKMTVFIEKSVMRIDTEVFASKQMKDGKKLTIKSDSAEFNSHNHEALFSGNVVMKYDQMEIKGPQAAFAYSSGSSVLKSIFINGGVQAQDQQKFATSENLTVDLLSNKIFLRGQPKLVQNNDELHGDEIIFSNNGKKVKVQKVKAKVDQNQ